MKSAILGGDKTCVRNRVALVRLAKEAEDKKSGRRKDENESNTTKGQEGETNIYWKIE